MMTRIQKQLIYGIVFIIVIGALGFWIYGGVKHQPTCFDKIQNQTEEGVDCGSVCGNTCLQSLTPISVKNSHLFKIQELNGQTDYDALFRVTNPNTQFGSSNAEYELNILDVQGNSLFRKTGSFYILPGQTKYVYEPLLKTKTPADRAELKIASVDWQKLQGVFNEDIKVITKSKEFLSNGKPGVQARVIGTLFNSSVFDLDKVDVLVVLYLGGEPIGANRTDIRTFLSQTNRFFEVDWVNPLPTPDRIDVEASTNVFENSNFLKRYGVPEKFQQLF